MGPLPRGRGERRWSSEIASLMGGDALGARAGHSCTGPVVWFRQGKPDYLSIPVQVVEMGDPGPNHFDGARRVICDGRIFLVRAGQWDAHAVFLRSQGSVWADDGVAKDVRPE